MKKKIIEEIEKLHREDKHEKIIQIIYSMNENEKDHHIISLLARALNNIQNYDEALNNLIFILLMWFLDCVFSATQILIKACICI